MKLLCRTQLVIILDEELALLPGSLTPRLQEALVRLSTHIPSFAKAAREVAFFTGTQVPADTTRRRTEAAGVLLVAHETAQAERILRDLPTPPCGPDTLVFSVDSAMIPLVHGEWTEVRTLVVGEVQAPQPSPDGPRIHTTNLSYFSRRLDSTTFAEAAVSELHRRGIERAGRVGAVEVLKDLRELVAAHPTLSELPKQLAYLEKRVGQMAYPQFVAEGWPIGSGMVESANKLVVEDRLKGAGMHWVGVTVTPMLALRNAVCNDRWEEVWSIIEREQHRQMVVQRQRRRVSRLAAARAVAPIQEAPPVPDEQSHPQRLQQSLWRRRVIPGRVCQ